jgi:hypothetical protein
MDYISFGYGLMIGMAIVLAVWLIVECRILKQKSDTLE